MFHNNQWLKAYFICRTDWITHSKSQMSILVMESNDNQNENNNQVADSSEQEFQYDFGTYGWFGLQLKNLSNVMNGVGQQMKLRSETLKNAAGFELESSMHTG